MDIYFFVTSLICYFVAKRIIVRRLARHESSLLNSIEKGLEQIAQRQKSISRKIEAVRRSRENPRDIEKDWFGYLVLSESKYSISHKALLDRHTLQVLHVLSCRTDKNEVFELPFDPHFLDFLQPKRLTDVSYHIR
jgi:hypothetical protein